MFFYLLTQMFQLLLMYAEFFGAIGTFKISVSVLGKTLGILKERNLPPDEKRYCQEQKAPCQNASDKEQRSKHHCVIPIVDSAGTAAFVLKKPGLERAEKQYAYHVTDGIRDAEQQHNALVKDVEHVERTEYSVENYPYQCDQDRSIIIGDFYFRFSRLYVVPLKLFLATGTLIFRREETKIISTAKTIQISIATVVCLPITSSGNSRPPMR